MTEINVHETKSRYLLMQPMQMSPIRTSAGESRISQKGYRNARGSKDDSE
jgi:hypothetical protein